MRRLFAVASLISLMASVAILVLWIDVGSDKQRVMERFNNPDIAGWTVYPRILIAITPYWCALLFAAVLPGLWVANRVIGLS